MDVRTMETTTAPKQETETAGTDTLQRDIPRGAIEGFYTQDALQSIRMGGVLVDPTLVNPTIPGFVRTVKATITPAAITSAQVPERQGIHPSTLPTFENLLRTYATSIGATIAFRDRVSDGQRQSPVNRDAVEYAEIDLSEATNTVVVQPRPIFSMKTTWAIYSTQEDATTGRAGLWVVMEDTVIRIKQSPNREAIAGNIEEVAILARTTTKGSTSTTAFSAPNATEVRFTNREFVPFTGNYSISRDFTAQSDRPRLAADDSVVMRLLY